MNLPSGTPAYLSTAQDAHQTLVVIPDIWGLRPLFTDMCDDLSQRTGWSVGSFDPFGGADLPTADHPDGFAERSGALRRLDDSAVLTDAVSVADASGTESALLIGFCMGGMYALKASAVGRFDRVVGFYGMIRVPEDWEGEGQGQPLDALAERGDCEVMAVVGTVDPWTPPDQVDQLEALGVEVVRYEGADHGFVHDPSRPTHRADDAADAWQRALSFLRDGPSTT